MKPTRSFSIGATANPDMRPLPPIFDAADMQPDMAAAAPIHAVPLKNSLRLDFMSIDLSFGW